MDVTTAIGVIGAGIVLVGFILNQFGKLKVESKTYDIINVIGPTLLVWYAYLLESYPFLVLNVVWTIASIWSLMQDNKEK